jgi:hypothetical protein
MFLYIESIRAGAISAQTKSGHTHTLYKGLNKLAKSDWDELKEVPIIKAYFEAGTLKERPEIKAKGQAPEKAPKQEQPQEQVQEPVVEETQEETQEQPQQDEVQEPVQEDTETESE